MQRDSFECTTPFAGSLLPLDSQVYDPLFYDGQIDRCPQLSDQSRTKEKEREICLQSKVDVLRKQRGAEKERYIL